MNELKNKIADVLDAQLPWVRKDLLELADKIMSVIPAQEPKPEKEPNIPEKSPTCVDLNYNCTTAKMAEQIGIKLWQAMVMMKYAELKITKPTTPEVEVPGEPSKNMIVEMPKQGVHSEIVFPLGQDEIAVSKAIKELLDDGWEFGYLTEKGISVIRRWET